MWNDICIGTLLSIGYMGVKTPIFLFKRGENNGGELMPHYILYALIKKAFSPRRNFFINVVRQHTQTLINNKKNRAKNRFSCCG